jgi:hypothetical protein
VPEQSADLVIYPPPQQMLEPAGGLGRLLLVNLDDICQEALGQALPPDDGGRFHFPRIRQRYRAPPLLNEAGRDELRQRRLAIVSGDLAGLESGQALLLARHPELCEGFLCGF